VQLTTSDGHVLDADIAEPPDGAQVLGGVVVCHPHPLYGGNRFDNVVEALFRALPAGGFTTLRFDFRRDHGDGTAERLDVVAALDALRETGAAPLLVAGYSFGAAVALGTVDDRIAALAVVAPPLTMLPAETPSVPTLVLTPEHDQFCPPEAARAIVGAWPTAELEIIESADHFLVGSAAGIAERVTGWLTAFAST
jgi:alpha/beta superfamily hydrolase